MGAGLVVQVEGPIHVSEAARRFYTATDITRSSKRVQSAVNEAADHLVTSGRLKAWWITVEQRHDPVAGSESVRAPAATRQLKMVSTKELAEAACMVVGRPYGIAPDQAQVRVFKFLGHSHTTDVTKIGSTAW